MCVMANFIRMFFVLLLASVLGRPAWASSEVSTSELKISLVSELQALVPGNQQYVGVLIEHQPHWHSY